MESETTCHDAEKKKNFPFHPPVGALKDEKVMGVPLDIDKRSATLVDALRDPPKRTKIEKNKKQ